MTLLPELIKLSLAAAHLFGGGDVNTNAQSKIDTHAQEATINEVVTTAPFQIGLDRELVISGYYYHNGKYYRIQVEEPRHHRDDDNH
ncbi:MAG: hypothetical protein ABII21_00400 [bacterium]